MSTKAKTLPHAPLQTVSPRSPLIHPDGHRDAESYFLSIGAARSENALTSRRDDDEKMPRAVFPAFLLNAEKILPLLNPTFRTKPLISFRKAIATQGSSSFLEIEERPTSGSSLSGDPGGLSKNALRSNAVSGSALATLLRDRYAQPLTTLGAPPFQDILTRLGLHPLAKSVRP